jgi:hypothetical protein
MAPAPERNSILKVIVPADGTIAATGPNGDFSTSPFLGSSQASQPLACIWHVGYRS